MRFKTLSVPERAHPLVREMYELMNRERVGLNDLAWRSGNHKDTLSSWRRRGAPRVDMLEAALNVLGYRLSIEPIKREAAE